MCEKFLTLPLKDQVGTVYKVVDGKTNAIVDSRVYDVFGNLISQSGTSKSNIGFQGKYYDKESGLYYFYHRYYLPNIGRFTTEDPIGFEGGFNLYEYVKQNPLNLTDPFGHKTDCQDCEKLFWDCLGNMMAPGLGDLLIGSANAAGFTTRAQAWAYAAEKGLIVPLRSSVFRRMWNFGTKLGPTFAVGYFTYAVWYCLIKEIECLKNQ